MAYNGNDIPDLSRQLNLSFAIQAKTDIQNQLKDRFSMTEVDQLANDIVPDTLVFKLKVLARDYLNRTRKSPAEVYAVALATGTILKELDNGNTRHVTNDAVANLMNDLM